MGTERAREACIKRSTHQFCHSRLLRDLMPITTEDPPPSAAREPAFGDALSLRTRRQRNHHLEFKPLPSSAMSSLVQQPMFGLQGTNVQRAHPRSSSLSGITTAAHNTSLLDRHFSALVHEWSSRESLPHKL